MYAAHLLLAEQEQIVRVLEVDTSFHSVRLLS